LKNDSTQIINVSKSASTLESLKEFFNIKFEKPEAKLKATKFGTFNENKIKLINELQSKIDDAYLREKYIKTL
jgi:hypothetical protein